MRNMLNLFAHNFNETKLAKTWLDLQLCIYKVLNLSYFIIFINLYKKLINLVHQIICLDLRFNKLSTYQTSCYLLSACSKSG